MTTNNSTAEKSISEQSKLEREAKFKFSTNREKASTKLRYIETNVIPKECALCEEGELNTTDSKK